jgi:hypothetical protein
MIGSCACANQPVSVAVDVDVELPDGSDAAEPRTARPAGRREEQSVADIDTL